MKYILLILNLVLSLTFLGQAYCINDVCETAIELTPCVEEPLSENCTTTYSQEIIEFNIDYPPFNTGTFIFNDHWYMINIPDTVNVTIDLESNYSHPLATLNSLYGINEGVRFVLYYGNNCSNLEPVFFSQAPITAGLNCTNITDPVFIETLQAAWLWENVGLPADGLCPFDPTVQNINITVTLIPGTYWFQVFPFTSGDNISYGTGTLEVCFNFFLSNINEKEIKYKVVHVLTKGFLIFNPKTNKYYDFSLREVTW